MLIFYPGYNLYLSFQSSTTNTLLHLDCSSENTNSQGCYLKSRSWFGTTSSWELTVSLINSRSLARVLLIKASPELISAKEGGVHHTNEGPRGPPLPAAAPARVSLCVQLPLHYLSLSGAVRDRVKDRKEKVKRLPPIQGGYFYISPSPQHLGSMGPTPHP